MFRFWEQESTNSYSQVGKWLCFFSQSLINFKMFKKKNDMRNKQLIVIVGSGENQISYNLFQNKTTYLSITKIIRSLTEVFMILPLPPFSPRIHMITSLLINQMPFTFTQPLSNRWAKSRGCKHFIPSIFISLVVKQRCRGFLIRIQTNNSAAAYLILPDDFRFPSAYYVS